MSAATSATTAMDTMRAAGAEARARIWAGFDGPTSWMAPGLVQANLISMPA